LEGRRRERQSVKWRVEKELICKYWKNYYDCLPLGEKNEDQEITIKADTESGKKDNCTGSEKSFISILACGRVVITVTHKGEYSKKRGTKGAARGEGGTNSEKGQRILARTHRKSWTRMHMEPKRVPGRRYSCDFTAMARKKRRTGQRERSD